MTHGKQLTPKIGKDIENQRDKIKVEGYLPNYREDPLESFPKYDFLGEFLPKNEENIGEGLEMLLYVVLS